MTAPQVITLDKLGKNDVEIVGGKNASLGEMISHLSDLGVSVPGGFATTAAAFNNFLTETGLLDKINNELKELDVDDVKKLTETGEKIRKWIIEQELPKSLEQEIRDAFEVMSDGDDIAVAVRSSATAEDLPDASFAGQQETYLNIRGIENVLIAIKEVSHHYIMTALSLTVFIKVSSTLVLPYQRVFSVWFAQKQAQQALCSP